MRRALPAVLALVCAALLSGCLSMPTSGPVHETGEVPTTGQDAAFPFDPRPPVPGESPAQIVSDFLDAMQATPLQTTTARMFLSKDLANSWDPQQETITYADKAPPRGMNPVTVDLNDPHHLDRRGSWQGPLPMARHQMHFSVTREDGQWRISQAPDALIVPESWFDDRYSRLSLYFFDPTARILVPEPVFVPRGDQIASALVRGLLRGPGPSLTGVVRTFLPTSASEGLSVPVSRGIAEVALTGDVGEQSPHAIQLMAAQLVWTLRQVPSVRRVRIIIDGRAVTSSDGDSFPVSEFAQYDPAGYDASTALWGLRDGALVTHTDDGFARVVGSWGQPRDLRSVAVDLSAEQAAAVTGDGRSVLVGPIERRGPVRSTPVRGEDLLTPAWDFADRLWLLDRTTRGARVSYLRDGTVTPVFVPGITGRDITSFLVSRDGSRLVACRRGQLGDVVVVSRLRSDAHGVVVRGTRARLISDTAEGTTRIRDLAWNSTTGVIALQQLPETALIRTIPVDGATIGAVPVTETVGDRLYALVGTPVAGNGLYAMTLTRLLDISGRGENISAAGVRSVGYVG